MLYCLYCKQAVGQEHKPSSTRSSSSPPSPNTSRLISERLRACYGYVMKDDDHWWNPKDDTDGDTIISSSVLWEYILDRRASDMEDWIR